MQQIPQLISTHSGPSSCSRASCSHFQFFSTAKSEDAMSISLPPQIFHLSSWKLCTQTLRLHSRNLLHHLVIIPMRSKLCRCGQFFSFCCLFPMLHGFGWRYLRWTHFPQWSWEQSAFFPVGRCLTFLCSPCAMCFGWLSFIHTAQFSPPSLQNLEEGFGSPVRPHCTVRW